MAYFLLSLCCYSEYEDDPVSTMDQLEITLFALQSWCLIPVYAVPESTVSADEGEDVIVGACLFYSSI